MYCERDDLFLLELETFIKTVVGNKYHLPIGKVLFHRKTHHQNIKQRKFFCSELIAKAYKQIGILESDKACHRFMPNNFSSSKELTLKNGANLGEELMIVFDEEDIKKEREKLLPDLEKQKAN